MLTRYWSWTSGPATGADAGLPFGPLRYRAWTTTPPAAALPFGPLRYRAWTSGAEVAPVIVTGPGGGSAIRIPVDALTRARLQRDDELILFVIAGAVATGILN